MTKGNRISFAVFCFDWSAQYPHCKQSTQFLFFIWSPHFSHPSLRLTSVDHCRCEFGLYSIYSIASALSFAYACIHQLLNVRRQSEHFQFIQIETYRCWCVRAQMCVLHLWKVFGTRRWCESWSFNLDSFFFFQFSVDFFRLLGAEMRDRLQHKWLVFCTNENGRQEHFFFPWLLGCG